MKRTYTIMTGNLGRGFEVDFAREYKERLVNAFRCEIHDGRMQPIEVAIKEGSGSPPRGGWESDPDEDVVREIADHEYNSLVAEYNEEPWGCDDHFWGEESDDDDDPTLEPEANEDVYRDIDRMSSDEVVDAEIAHENLPVPLSWR